LQMNPVWAFIYTRKTKVLKRFFWNLMTSSKYLTFNILCEYWVSSVLCLFTLKNRFTRFWGVFFLLKPPHTTSIVSCNNIKTLVNVYFLINFNTKVPINNSVFTQTYSEVVRSCSFLCIFTRACSYYLITKFLLFFLVFHAAFVLCTCT
jgi:hypothetical protein